MVKKTAKETTKPTKMPTPKPTAKTTATLKKMIIGVRDDELAAELFAEKQGVDIGAARAAVKKIRRSMAKAADDLDLKKELAQQLASLDSLYSSAIQAQDVKTALAIEKERGKMLSLYNRVEEKEERATDQEKEETRRILETADVGGYERLDDLARAVINSLIKAKTRKD